MVVTLEKAKNYLRVDFDEDDSEIEDMIAAAESLCMDIVRMDDADSFAALDKARVAVMYTVAYFYEHRDAADHHALTLTLRSLLGGDRKEAF